MSDFGDRLHPDGAPGIAVAQLRAQWGDAEFEKYVQRQQENHEAQLHQAYAYAAYHRAKASMFSALAFLAVVLAIAAAFVAVLWGVR